MTDEQDPKKVPKRRITRSFVILTVIFVAVLALLSFVVADYRNDADRNAKFLKATAALASENAKLAEENAQRIKDIQDSRLASCKKTYSGIKEVFQPFIPAKPTSQRQVEIIDAFNANIERLKKNCVNQTNPVKKKEKAKDD